MPFDVSPLALLAGLAGGVWGFVADRIGARWPEHEDGSIRAIDWRTVVVVVAGALALGALAVRFSAPLELAVFGAYTVALILLLATDLDQRLLPDLITLPAIPFALVFALSGLNPFVPSGDLPLTIGVALAIPAILGVLAIPFGAGAIGMGDLKLLVSAGLLLGPGRIVSGVVWGALFGGVVILLLLVTRRVSLRSYVPFGPFLIAGVLYGLLAIRY
jgi:leader peptidase (prepilin peptidase)/N-methyltransferase